MIFKFSSVMSELGFNLAAAAYLFLNFCNILMTFFYFLSSSLSFLTPPPNSSSYSSGCFTFSRQHWLWHLLHSNTTILNCMLNRMVMLVMTRTASKTTYTILTLVSRINILSLGSHGDENNKQKHI